MTQDMKRLVTTAACLLLGLAPAPAGAQDAAQRALQSLGFVGAGPGRRFEREVRLLERRLDEPHTRFLVGDTVFHPDDFLPIIHARGVDVTPSMALRFGRIVYGGVLGATNAVAPFDVRGKVVVFLPPLNAEGHLVPEVWRYQELLEPYLLRDTALAVVMVGLDLLGPGAEQRLRAPTIVPRITGRPRDYPPLLLVRRQVASFLLNNDVDDVPPGFASRHLGHDFPTDLTQLRFRPADRELPQRATLFTAERPGRRGALGVLVTAAPGRADSEAAGWLRVVEALSADAVLQEHSIRVAVADTGPEGEAALSLALIDEDGPRRRLRAHVHVAPALDRWRDQPCGWTVRRADIVLTVDPSVPPSQVLGHLHDAIVSAPSQPTELAPGLWRCPSAAAPQR
jgi:hypothetical protein